MITTEQINNFITYILQAIMFFGLAISIFSQNYLNIFLITLIILFTFIPTIVHKRYDFHIPSSFNLIIIVFIFAALFLGEIHGFYTRFPWWDLLLHSTSSFLLGLVGFLLVYTLNYEEKIHLNMKPRFIALFAFAFALAIGVIWEIFEFSMDSFFGLNMQKSGLIDTMWDLIVDTLGALVVSILGYLFFLLLS